MQTIDEDKIIDKILNYISENEDKNKVEEYKNCINNSLNQYIKLMIIITIMMIIPHY